MADLFDILEDLYTNEGGNKESKNQLMNEMRSSVRQLFIFMPSEMAKLAHIRAQLSPLLLEDVNHEVKFQVENRFIHAFKTCITDNDLDDTYVKQVDKRRMVLALVCLYVCFKCLTQYDTVALFWKKKKRFLRILFDKEMCDWEALFSARFGQWLGMNFSETGVSGGDFFRMRNMYIDRVTDYDNILSTDRLSSRGNVGMMTFILSEFGDEALAIGKSLFDTKTEIKRIEEVLTEPQIRLLEDKFRSNVEEYTLQGISSLEMLLQCMKDLYTHVTHASYFSEMYEMSPRTSTGLGTSS